MTYKEAYFELLTYIDLAMHGKQYRFEEENDMIYSREACEQQTIEKTNKEIIEEINKNEESFERHIDELEKANQKIKQLEKALELACDDRCKIENALWSKVFGKNTRQVIQKHSQWFIEEAQKLLEEESND